MQIAEILNYIISTKYSAFFYTPKIYKTGKSILFKSPQETIIAKGKDDFFEQLKNINSLIETGLTGYGLINYEAGYLLEERLTPLFQETAGSILTFIFFESDQIQIFQDDEIEYEGAKNIFINESYSITNFQLNTEKEVYKNNITKIRDYIKEGDTYQVNYTVKGKFDFEGDIKTLFLNLIFNQSAKYSAIINTGDDFIISISPELFFDVTGNKITANPMKGTIKRGLTNEEDRLKIETLLESKKDRSENVMILDLLRNDLGKVSEFNSVKVTSPFNIEKYESLFQMTSTVEAKLRGNNFEGIIKNIFPCGSITGAPKIRTMRIINELENEPRGIYTGAIGIVQKGNYKFNVPIRTVKISKEGKSEIGLGSGVVWDSDPEEEYNETLLKSNFLIKPENYFELFESILIENGKPFLLKEHLQRLNEASDYFLFNFNYDEISKGIFESAAVLDIDKKYKMKISLDKWGEFRIQNSEISKPAGKIKIVISDKRINSKNKFQYFKTTNRKLYEDELKKYRELGFYEIIFLNEKNEIAEGSFTNIFIYKNNEWLSPPVSSGILNGVYRKYFLEKNKISRDCVLKLADLENAEKILLVNSVRKEIIVDEVHFEKSERVSNE